MSSLTHGRSARSGFTRRTPHPARIPHRLLTRPVRHPGDDRLRVRHARPDSRVAVSNLSQRVVLVCLGAMEAATSRRGREKSQLGMDNNGTSTTLSIPNTSMMTLEPATSEFRSKLSSGLDFLSNETLGESAASSARLDACLPTHTRRSRHN
ncbi:hypothetical protein FRC09_017999 [Ceratobasidium sp. 395]|nr:hypothetical protein FRC09_017999 [Ceratobasidium sp. 395]